MFICWTNFYSHKKKKHVEFIRIYFVAHKNYLEKNDKKFVY